MIVKTSYGTFKKITENGEFEAISPECVEILSRNFSPPDSQINIQYAIYNFEAIKRVLEDCKYFKDSSPEDREEKEENYCEIMGNVEEGLEALSEILIHRQDD
jgi:hypothetical protein